MNTEILQYIVFGASILLCLITFTFSEKLVEASFFNKCAIAAGMSSIIGIFLEAEKVFNLETGMTILLMSVSTIFLFYFGVLLWVFRKLKGFDPYITDSRSRIRDPIIYWSKEKYKLGRLIIWEDFVFSMLQALLPAFTILFLIAYLVRRL